jgi:MATE family multidrug resistance protein
MLRAIKRRWRSSSGYKEVLVLAIPLIITTSSGGLQSFIDRMFLSWFDSNALAATVPARMICITLTSLFIGTASYVGVFVAQYYGAQDYKKIGAVVWQGFYIIGLSLVVVIPVFIFAKPLFHWIGHDPILQAMETSYSRILILSVPIMIISSALSGFFSGISRTAVVMWSNLLITLINLLLDYLLIFGHWGMPEMGIEGAACATVISISIGTTLQLWIFFKQKYRQRFMTRLYWQPNWVLFKRLLKFGFPVGVQMQMQTLAWTLFVLLIGKIGVAELTAHSIAMNIFMLAVMPVAGMSIAVSVLVGQRLGDSNPESAQRATVSAVHLAAVFFVFIGLMLVIEPNWFIAPFSKGMAPSISEVAVPLVQDLLRIVAMFCLFEAVSMMMAGALKGAGDTRFVAWTGIVISWLVLVLPTALLVFIWGGHLLWSWTFFLLNGFLMCLVHWLRFRSAKWKSLRVTV